MESMIMIVALMAVMYFFMIRPENKRKKQAQNMRDSLKKGDMITTIGGIVGKIVMVNPNTIVIETSDDRVRMELTKWAVSQVGVQTGEQPEADEGASGELFFHYQPRQEHRQKDGKFADAVDCNGICVTPVE